MNTKILFLAPVLACIFFFKSVAIQPPAPKLYPELVKYFASVKNNSINKNDKEALDILKGALALASMDSKDLNFIFLCKDNSFRSQVAQIFLETLSTTKKVKRVKSLSAGEASGEIDARLIDFLNKIGYKVSKTTVNNKVGYEVKYSDEAPAILIYGKDMNDPALNVKETYPIAVDPADFAHWEEVKFSYPLSKLEVDGFKDLASADIDTAMGSIAACMVYLTDK
ncbi:hypothetical protein [Chitinophaga filiformis]|uniref:Protein-tyrosine-phosphatase n=1 Tax=Chitinophaga filiformis TaxID=104663 RepID=A0ABY4I8R0_CHIFI|nr:hypothetical protein [Chitinophaga filiformis]UPK72468.1 hypothetical protein MYF79_14340 [Chitinophaga filiformis]